MLGGPHDVRLQGETGSSAQTAKVTRLTLRRLQRPSSNIIANRGRARVMSPVGTFRTSRDVRLGFAMRAKADIGPGDREARR